MKPNHKKTFAVKTVVAVSLAWLIMLGSPPAHTQATGVVDVSSVGAVSAIVGKSTVVKLPTPATRVAIAEPAIADVVLLSPREVYVLGKAVGNTNLTVWGPTGTARAIDVAVALDAPTVQQQLRKFVPGAEAVQVAAVGTSLVLSGRVADAIKVHQVLELVQGFSPKKIVNLLRVDDPQQVMLEVKVAEISRTLLDKLGAEFRFVTNGTTRLGIVSRLLSGSDSLLFGFRSEDKLFTLDAEKQDGLVKILAEPTILAISGEQGSFLAGGKIFIPIPQGTSGNVAQYVLQEKEFGVRLRFIPTVLEGGKIHLKVSPEVSEVSQQGIRITASGVPPSVIPAITTREVSTTVQLRDGESLAIGGLIKNNATTNVRAMPVLGEIPILGALFRSTDFQNDRTELLFIVTPRLVQAGKREYPLPTDAYREPSREDLYLKGRIEAVPAVADEPEKDAAQSN